ncbi:MAG: class I SAM-dependent methyltransferase [Tissierellia bacterium]|nr:class I SAM-dependent methyltransferase [Tissierellia bacterium]
MVNNNNRNLFEVWSSSDNGDVKLANDNKKYTFAAYNKIQEFLKNRALKHRGRKALDIGIGTTDLSTELSKEGFDITGIDFSEKMTEMSREKLPESKIISWDFSNGLPNEIEGEKYNIVFCNYSIHQLEFEQQINLIKEIVEHLCDDGILFIADVMAKYRKELEILSKRVDDWDDEENYIVYDEIKDELPNLYTDYIKFSYCSGIVEIRKLRIA